MALGELERYTEARIGNVKEPEPTGKFIATTFEHDTAPSAELKLANRELGMVEGIGEVGCR